MAGYIFRNNSLLSDSQGLRMLEAVKSSCWRDFGLEIQVMTTYFLAWNRKMWNVNSTRNYDTSL